ncbi:MAG: methyltransferase [Pseudomonadota bacterium]
MTNDSQDLTCDAFLGGQLNIWQPKNGYRAGIDPVLLAASVAATSGEELLDLGCGVGVAALCATRRVAGLRVTGLELQPLYAELARRNAHENNVDFHVIEGDLANLPLDLKERQFNHVIANPPYFDRKHSQPSANQEREAALGESTPLSTWVKIAAQRTKPKGYVTFILRTERLPEFLTEADKRLGSFQLLPLIPHSGQESRLILIRGRRDGRAAFRLHPGWILHEDEVLTKSTKNYTKATNSILRDGKSLSFIQ